MFGLDDSVSEILIPQELSTSHFIRAEPIAVVVVICLRKFEKVVLDGGVDE